VGWQVMLDGLEITQFTYFQQCGGIDLDLVPAEITYGLERLTAFLQGVDSVYDIEWTPGVKYATCATPTNCSIRFTTSNSRMFPTLWKLFEIHEGEARRLLDLYKNLPKKPLPAARRLRSRAEVQQPL
jgi:glycyl-tRNA synthetase alpha chain